MPPGHDHYHLWCGSAYCLRITVSSQRMGAPKWKQYGKAWKKCLTIEHNVLEQKLCGFPPVDTNDGSQDLTEASSQIHWTGPTEKHMPVAHSDTSWQSSIYHLKEIQLRQCLNKYIQGQRKYFPELLLISWLTAERIGIANLIWWLKLLCL